MTNENDGRMDFVEAFKYVEAGKGAAFAVTPVFGDAGDESATAEGARVFVLRRDDEGEVRLRFVAGPFFSAAYAANEEIDADETPDSVRELRFLPSHCDPAWFTEQVQVLINRLMNAGHLDSQMPDYLHPSAKAAPEAVFPISFIGKSR